MTSSIILDFCAFFLMGISIGCMVYDHFIIKPLLKQRNQAIDGWVNSVAQHLDFLKKIVDIKDPEFIEVQEDGSAKSPLQVPLFKKKDD